MTVKHEQSHIYIPRDILISIVIYGRQRCRANPNLPRDCLVHGFYLTEEVFLVGIIVENFEAILGGSDRGSKERVGFCRELKACHEPTANGGTGF